MAYHLRVLQRSSIGIKRPDPVAGYGARKLVAWCEADDADTCFLLKEVVKLEVIPRKAVILAIDKLLQDQWGIASIRHEGPLGHIYYLNDLAAIIAQVRAVTVSDTQVTFV